MTPGKYVHASLSSTRAARRSNRFSNAFSPGLRYRRENRFEEGDRCGSFSEVGTRAPRPSGEGGSNPSSPLLGLWIVKGHARTRKCPVRKFVQHLPARMIAGMAGELGAPKPGWDVHQLHQRRPGVVVRGERIGIETEAFRRVPCSRCASARCQLKWPRK
jgi:hypothetical protein